MNQYKLKKQIEKIGSFEFELECLDNLDETIDQVFKQLENHKNPRTLEELCPYFGVVWPAARALAEYLADLPESKIRGKTVLELGCGLALPSILATKRLAHVVATDFHPEVWGFLESNIKINHIQNITYRNMNWENRIEPAVKNFDWIIGSDILYESRYSASLALNLSKQVNQNGHVVIADPGRPYLQDFVDAMKNQGFDYQTQTKKVSHPPFFQEIFILIFNRKKEDTKNAI